jgi:orotidine-5'-phosphate decarboxylase
MMRAAVKGAEKNVNKKVKILGVTVLTSMNEEECNLSFGAPVKAKVLQFARNAVLAGLYGIVCSPLELEFLSKFPETDSLIKVTPGIRPQWHIDPSDDQSRITTPAKAVKMGSDYLVIGRPILKADDPLEAFLKTKDEVEKAEAGLS